MLTTQAAQQIQLPCLCFKRLHSTKRSLLPRRPGACRASGDDRQQKGGIDWNAEFRKAKASEALSHSRFPPMHGCRLRLDFMTCVAPADFPKVEDSTSRSSPRVRRDQIREQETFMLDIFSQENFFKVPSF